MPNEWHYTQNNQPAAEPVSTAELKQMAATGRLLPTDLVWQEGMAGWVPASTIKGLFPSPQRSGEIPVPAPAESPRERPEPARQREPQKQQPARRRERQPTDTGDLTATSGLLEMHPFVVFLLTLLTLGVFGFLYALSASKALAKLADRRAVDSQNRPLGRFQHPVRILVLSLVTFGFYFPFWASRALRECNAYTGRASLGGRLEFCLMMAVPFYAFFVVGFRLVPLVREVQARAGIPEEERLDRFAPIVAGGFAALIAAVAGTLFVVVGLNLFYQLLGDRLWLVFFILVHVCAVAIALLMSVSSWIPGMACQEALNDAWQAAA